MGSITYDFEDEVVVITGASAGIGRAVARRFGEAGAIVINADHREGPKKDSEELPTHEVIEQEGGTAEYIETDVSNYDDLESAVELARGYGGVNVMINNAGAVIPGEFLDVEPEDFDRLHQVNPGGVFFGTQIAANDMIDRGEPGSIVNTASISSRVAQHDQVQYDSSKGAVKMITRGTALDLAEYEIRVNAVAPGQIATEFMDGWSEDVPQAAGKEESGFIKPIPLARGGYPDDLDSPYLFLASEDAGLPCFSQDSVGVGSIIHCFTA